ncbi:Alpha/Beta hydrolase protein [Cyathus striatus]|nr:Alpha/Beta hydrolase protein [Cyathus striatus]
MIFLFLLFLRINTILTVTGVLVKSSDGTEIFTSAVGSPRNPPIVFIHGYSFSSLVFDDLFEDERLLSRFYMVSYDLRGHGRSGKPNTTEAYVSNLFADDFVAVIKHFNVKSPLYAGWSYGGKLDPSDAQEFPNNIPLGTVMTDIFSFLPPQTISGIFAIAAIPAIQLLVSTPFALTINPLFGVANDVAVDIDTKNTFVEACFKNASNIPIRTRWTWLGSSVLQLPPISTLVGQRMQDPTKLFEAGARGFPFLAISGTADNIILNDNITEEIQPHFTNLEVYRIEGGSHALFIDNKDELIQVLIPFANKVLKRT